PDIKPALDFGYFTDEGGYDATTIVDGLKLAREVAAREPFASKPQLAGLLDRAHAAGIRAAFVAGAEVYGGRQLRRGLRQRGMGYVMAVRAGADDMPLVFTAGDQVRERDLGDYRRSGVGCAHPGHLVRHHATGLAARAGPCQQRPRRRLPTAPGPRRCVRPGPRGAAVGHRSRPPRPPRQPPPPP